jgi:biotin synthase-related radical SAM superfamily protein
MGQRIAVRKQAAKAMITAGTSQADDLYPGEGSNTMNGDISSTLRRVTWPSTTLAAIRTPLFTSRQTKGAISL